MERERNEPPLEAGVLVPPGAPYIGCPGDKVRPTIYCTATLHTVAELTTWVLSALWPASARYRPWYCALHHGHGLVPSCLSLAYLVFVF
jgi:hypothetical protein